MIIVVILVFVILALSDFPRLIKNKKWYEVTVLSCFYVFVFILAALQSFEVILPSPAKGIENFIVNVLHLGYPKQ